MRKGRWFLATVFTVLLTVALVGPPALKPLRDRADRECSMRTDAYGGYTFEWRVLPYPHWLCTAQGGKVSYDLGWI
jgi:hypothetical protein